MNTYRIKQLLATGLLGLTLSACSAPLSPNPEPRPQVIGPTSGPTTGQSTQPTNPQAVPALPPLNDPAWVELWRGDNNANLVDERVLYLPATVKPQTNFNDEFLAAQAVAVTAIVISEERADGPVVLFQVDQRGLSGPATQLNFGPGPVPAAFLAALDPGSSYFLSMLPLTDDGTADGEFLAINWYGAQGGYTLAPLPNR
ncbi:MAG: hypothetical protein AB4911_13335 [Oscillochloridaceae bacterium umkhey_bin13]